MQGKISVGTASWSDIGFVGQWYPKGLPANQRLRWYAEHFNLVEVNSTFYQVPVQRYVERWCEQTPDDFVFDVKLHRLLSRHSTKPQFLPADIRAKATVKKDKVTLTPELEAEIANRFLESTKPFENAGKMGAFLLQLSPSFSPHNNDLSELDLLLDLFRGKRLAIELRNRHWLAPEHHRETVKWFQQNHVIFAMVDAPDDPHFMVMPGLNLITNPKLAYIRAHGRNARGYISGRSVAERFDYDYSDEEIEELAQRAATVAHEAEELHFIFNNNTANYAPKAAERLVHTLAQEHPEAVSEAVAHREAVHA